MLLLDLVHTVLGLLIKTVHLVRKAPRDHKEHKVHVDHKDHKDHKDKLGHKAPVGHKDHKDHKVLVTDTRLLAAQAFPLVQEQNL
jgi:hypothetical protein